MKKKSLLLISIIVITATVVASGILLYKSNSNKVSVSGYLRVDGNVLRNRFGIEYRLRGVSSHGIQWEDGSIINYDNLKKLHDEWNINVFRIAMYTEEDRIYSK